MEPFFKTLLVKANQDKGTRSGYVIIAVFILASIALASLGYNEYATISFCIALVVIVIVLLVKKGNVQAYSTTKDALVLTPLEIKVEGKIYKISEIKNLRLLLHSFNGMNFKDGSSSDGMGNTISFNYSGLEYYYWFYIANRQHTVELCAVLREYYRNKIPVHEKDYKGYRTWLMQRLDTPEEIRKFKERHKIP